MELVRHFCPDCDSTVHEFSNLSYSHGAYAEGRNDELLEAPDTEHNIEIKKRLIFKDLPTLEEAT
jgi:hypothetical protein